MRLCVHVCVLMFMGHDHCLGVCTAGCASTEFRKHPPPPPPTHTHTLPPAHPTGHTALLTATTTTITFATSIIAFFTHRPQRLVGHRRHEPRLHLAPNARLRGACPALGRLGAERKSSWEMSSSLQL